MAVSPLVDKAITLVDPLFDKKITEGLKQGKLTEKEAYEKTKPQTGPVIICEATNCAEKFLKCPNFHDATDCDEWVRNKTSCKGTCGKYHRIWVGGRGFTKGLGRSGGQAAKAPISVSPEMCVHGKLTVGLKKDMTTVTKLERRKVTLSAGVFNLNGQPLHQIYPDPNLFLHEGKMSGLEHFSYKDDSIIHSGDDTDDPEPGLKPTTYSFNQAISIDFAKLPVEVGAIIVGITIAYPDYMENLKNSFISLFSTPKTPSPVKDKDVLLSIPLEPNGELQNQPGYIFGKFVRTVTGWKFVTIREANGSTSSKTITENFMHPYARESTTTFIPGALEDLNFHISSFTKDKSSQLPIKSLGFVVLDFKGNRVKNENVFTQITKDGSHDITLTYKNNGEPVGTIFIYSEHDEDTQGFTCLVAEKKDELLVCNIGNIAPAQIIARITCIAHGEMTRDRWQISTFSMPLSQKNGELDLSNTLYEMANTQRLIPKVPNGISQLRAAVISSGRHNPKTPAEKLIVEVLHAKNLAVKDLRTSDPFIIVNVEKQKQKTPFIRSNLNPIWNTKLLFQFEDIVEDKPVVKFKCKDWNLLASAKAMGVASFDLADLMSNTMKYGAEITLPLETDPKHPKQAVSGSIVVRVHFG